jgi:Glyoxalase/Bleomycin resistance protein/Dioxygenase superfamily
VNGADQFHIGIVVEDLDATLDEFGGLLGYEWCPVVAVETPVVLPRGEIMLDLRFAYSKTEPRVEMIRAVPGTLWVPVQGSGIHHAGYWSEDLAVDGERLDASGFAQEARGVGPDGTPMWAYYSSPKGPRIELVSRQLQPGLEQYWASG